MKILLTQPGFSNSEYDPPWKLRGYYWPLTPEGNAERVKVCLQFAEETKDNADI